MARAERTTPGRLPARGETIQAAALDLPAWIQVV
jgi:hypothetical protein